MCGFLFVCVCFIYKTSKDFKAHSAELLKAQAVPSSLSPCPGLPRAGRRVPRVAAAAAEGGGHIVCLSSPEPGCGLVAFGTVGDSCVTRGLS